MLEKLNGYAMALLTASVAVSSIIHVLGLDKTPAGATVLKVCFDVGGLVKAVLGFGKADK